MNHAHFIRHPGSDQRVQVLPANSTHRQHGAALITALVILLVLTLLGIAAMRTGSLEQIMAGNIQEANRAFQAAESGLARAAGDASTFSLGTETTRNYSFDSGRSGSAEIKTKWIQVTPPRRGGGFSMRDFDAAHFDQNATASTVTGARSKVHQGVELIIPKSN